MCAKDSATGKEQRIEIKSSAGLSEEEIEKMVQDAEAHAEEDRKFHETVTARNNADPMVHATRSSLKEMGDKIGEEDRKNIDTAIEGVEAAMKEDDKDAIDTATTELTEAAQVIYQQAQADAEAGAADAAGAGRAGAAPISLARRFDVFPSKCTTDHGLPRAHVHSKTINTDPKFSEVYLNLY